MATRRISFAPGAWRSQPLVPILVVSLLIGAVVVMILISLFADRASEGRRDELVDEVEPFAIALRDLEITVADMSAEARAYGLTRGEEFLQRYNDGRTAFDVDVSMLRERARISGFGTQTEEVIAVATAWMAVSENIVAAASRGDGAELNRLVTVESAPLLDAFFITAQTLHQDVQREIEDGRDDVRRIDTIERVASSVAGAIGTLGAALMLWLVFTNQRLLRDTERERARFASMVTSIPGYGVCLVDRGERLLYLNPAGEEALGYRFEDLRLRWLHGVIHYKRPDGSDYPIEECPFVAALITGAIYRGTDSFIRSDGTFLPVEVAMAPSIVAGQTSEAVLVFQDISERLLRERMREDFISFASHELRSPITIVEGFAKRLDRLMNRSPGSFDEDSREAVEMVSSGAERLRTTIETVMDLTQIQLDHQLHLSLGRVDFVELLRTEVETLKARYPQAIIEGAYPAERMVGTSDQQRLRHVLANLLDNAAKYGGQPPLINVSLEKADEEVIIKVRDNGKGIAPEDQPFIFESFYRGASSSASRTGLGIGLFLSKHIVDQLGGTLKFQSVVGEGTEFTLTLPLASLSEAEVEDLPAVDADGTEARPLPTRQT